MTPTRRDRRPPSCGGSRWATTPSRQYPPLAVLAGWVSTLAGQTTEAQRWAAFADAATFEPAPATARHRSRRPGRCCARSCAPPVPSRRWPTRLRRRCGAAVEPLARPGARHPRRGAPARGRPRRGAALFEEAVAAGVGDSDAYVTVRADSALLAMDAGEWDDATDTPARARRHRRAPDARLRHERPGLRRGRTARPAPG